MREVLEALDWVRGEMWRFSSPDFIRQRQTEQRVGKLCARLLQGGEGVARAPSRVQTRALDDNRIRKT